eukprot:TRINITY_DN31827_c0_g1_i1.p1 TRINITY_DN31827_c0_g1~~TRINITY_DN31827_c0_g1_i1.p1  ORF type:complete len:674 (+),score=103.23 TRINITY_DN31827_c0_g1_i1:145-2166(+)
MRETILSQSSDDSSEDDASRSSSAALRHRQTRIDKLCGEEESVPSTWAIALSVSILVGMLLLFVWKTNHLAEFRDDLVRCAPIILTVFSVLIPVVAYAVRQQQVFLQTTIHAETSLALADLHLIITRVMTTFYEDPHHRRELEELGRNVIRDSLKHAYDKAWQEIAQAPHKAKNVIQEAVQTAFESQLELGTRPRNQNYEPKLSTRGETSREQPLAASKFEQLKISPFHPETEPETELHHFANMMFSHAHDAVQDNCLKKITGSTFFKLVSMAVILTNAVYLTFAVDFAVQSSYRHLQGHEKALPPLGVIPERCFELWFAIEILLRMGAEKWNFFAGEDCYWNIFDLMLVLESLFALTTQWTWNWNLSFLRVLRIFRLVRLVRLVRSAKALRRLRTMIFSIMNSFYDVLWAGCAIFLIVLVFALFFCVAVEDYYDGVDREDVHQLAEASEVNVYFGSVTESVISLWSAVSGGNDWMTYGELIRTLPGGHFLFSVFTFYVFFCMVGLFNVVTGVFVDSAIACRTADEVVEGYFNDLKETADGIKRFFVEADKDGSGTLTRTEFQTQMQHPDAQAYFAGLDIDPEEANTIFSIMDFDKTDSIIIDDFVNGTMRLKGLASKLDLIALMFDHTRQTKKLDTLCDLLEDQLAHLKAGFATGGQNHYSNMHHPSSSMLR